MERSKSDGFNVAAIVKAGAIKPLVKLLRSGSDDTKDYAAEALSRLTDNAEPTTHHTTLTHSGTRTT